MEEPAHKKRKVAVTKKEESSQLRSKEMTTSTDTLSTDTSKEVDGVIERLMKCFRTSKKKFSRAGMLFAKLVESSMSKENSSIFMKALDSAMTDRSRWTDSASTPILKRMVAAVSRKHKHENLRAYHIAVCVGPSFLTDDSFEYANASKEILNELNHRVPDQNRAALIVQNDTIMQEALIVALSQAFKQCRGFEAFRVRFKMMMEAAQKIRGTFQEDIRNSLDQISEDFYNLLNAPKKKKRAWTSDDYLKKTHPLRK